MTWRTFSGGLAVVLLPPVVVLGVSWSRAELDAGQPRRAPVETLDPQKGRWGGQSVDLPTGLALTARITPVVGRDDLFEIRLRVTAAGRAGHNGTPVTFHLHPSFVPSIVRAELRDGTAEVVRRGWSAFTVGAVVEPAGAAPIRLELDLAGLSHAPRRFRER